MKKFILPNMYEHHDLNFRLLKMKQDHPEYFHDDLSIYAVYGNFQFCIWDGGRIFPNNVQQATKEQMENILSNYAQYGVKVRFIFTNNMLRPEHYTNRFCNLILEVAS